MPHEIIMPALGMAQDTGKIVSWLKQSGDPVRIGDAIMEVETDKTTMEVEAQADGFLTDIMAGAGEDVPVGQAVARISDNATGSGAPPPVSNPRQDENTASGDNLPEGQSIIMPALGMTQDTGLIVAWHKSAGDPVSAGDILLEVETDKSVMEVEAGHDGYVAAILAETREVVPVGDIIAVISAQPPANPFSRSFASRQPKGVNANSEAPVTPSIKAAPKPATQAAPPAATKAAKVVPSARVLASPKARRLAREQGLDLSRLAEQGIAQPYHVADLETLRALPPAAQAGVSSASNATPLHVSARVPASGCDDFIRWLADDGNIKLEPAQLWLRFAAAALRHAKQHGSDRLVLGIDRPNADTTRYADPDTTRPTQPETIDAETVADLILRDLTGTLLISVRLTAGAAPVLTMGRDDASYVLGLDFLEAQLSETEAIQFLTDFAERLQEPLRHIL
ncbi:e3 binding domain protein [Hoeflea sp. IMCC20628]|uniref:biotin/lipoyl-containing protein n=1 Tax=Hoeflea sp. IMCC20628 TaxID=1620421 RepID=UPI00063AFC24|nr:biotin/lipoyl-containing protein [Hoeflea sp. IMCC20628]AKI01852.1 e3 binding domain protein [Hoeflea sp. IMCC20628]